MKIGRFLLLVVCTLVAGISIRYGVNKLSVYGSIAGHTAPLKERVPAYVRALHPKYPYSVIPGGAYTPGELQTADQEDPVVKEHYADFNLKKAQMVRLTDDRYQYASYRLNKRVYWTKKKLLIPKGELLLTDGNSWARARCGNRLSETAHPEVSPEEPPVKALAMPPMQLGTPMELAETRALGDFAAVAPEAGARFPPVLPPTMAPPPPELPPLTAATPPVPMMPAVPILFPPQEGGTLPTTTTSTPPEGTPPTVPPGITVPPGVSIPPTDTPPTVSTVPEPKALYLFLVTFVVSLYGLTRLLPANEKTGTVGGDEE